MQTETTLIQPEDRFGFYKHFNNIELFMLIEQSLYNIANQQISGYSGGHWHFHFSNEYQVPFFELNSDEPIHIDVGSNGFKGDVSSMVGSLALTSVLYNRCCWHFHEKGEEQLSKLFIRYFNALSTLAAERLEAGQKEYIEFFKIID